MRRHMKLAFAAGVLLGLGATSVASAADLALKARPVVAPLLYNWQGCYIGGNLGGRWSRKDTTRLQDDLVGPNFADYGRENDSGFIRGGHARCGFMGCEGLGVGGQGQLGLCGC